MRCLLKRVLPFILGLAVGIALVILVKTASHLTAFQSAFSGELDQIDVAPIPPSDLTRDELEAKINHLRGGLCYSNGKAVDIIETAADNRLTTKAKILYIPKPGSWEKEDPCTRCLVMVRVTLSASGKATKSAPVYISSRTGVGDDEHCMKNVLASIEQIRFEPAMKNGRPMSQLVTIIYDKWGSSN
jgi:hypothetical protein